MGLSKTRRARIEKAGFHVTSVQEYFDLSDAEMSIIEMRITLAKAIRRARENRQLTQAQLAKLIKSSQPRVAKIEAGDPDVSIEQMVKSALALGLSRRQIGKALAG